LYRKILSTLIITHLRKGYPLNYFIILVLIMETSCVTNKKIQYLQKDDVNPASVALDTVVRTYNTIDFDYKIQPNDVLLIRIESLTSEEFDFFSQSFSQQNIAGGGNQGISAGLNGELVDENGEIEFPVVGKVRVAGLTVFQVRDQIKEIAGQYVENPMVKVRLLNFRFTILGEVKGENTINTFNNRVTLLEAISLGGGVTEFADKSKIKLIRQRGTEIEIAYINLLDENFLTSPYFYIYQNDIIIVPSLKQRTFRRYFGPNLGLFVSTLSTLLLILSLLVL